MDLRHNLQSLAQGLSGFTLKACTKSLPCLIPYVGMCLRTELSGATFVLFNEFQVAMPVRWLTHLGNLGHHPKTVHECQLQRLADDGIQLIER